MQLTITIDLGAAVFTIESNDDYNGNPKVGPEVARILHAYAANVADAMQPSGLDGYDLRDINGNLVGGTEVNDD